MKKKVQISDSELKLLVVCLGIIFVVCSYFFVFVPKTNSKAEIEEKINTVQMEIDSLNNLVAQRPAIEKETKEYRQKIEEIKEIYPSALPEEKAIYLLQQFEDMAFIDIDSFGYTEGAVLATNGKDVSGYSTVVNITFTATYDIYKDFLDYIYNSTDRMKILTSTVAYDTTNGEVTSNTSIGMYYLEGSDKEYVDVPDLEIEKGVTNIFGSDN